MRRFCLAAAISMGSLGCFEEPGAGTTSTQTSGTSSDGSSSTNPTPTTTEQSSSSSSTGSTTEAPGTATGATTTTGSNASSSGTTTTTTTGGQPRLDFEDDFDRTNSGAIGNDWIEKDEPVFSIQDGQAIGDGPSSQSPADFHDWFVYRPDPVRDVELVVEFTVNTSDLRNEPFILSRVAETSLELGGNYAAYMAVAGTEDPPGEGGKPSNEHLCIAVFDGTTLGPQTSWCAQQQGGTLAEGFQYRLRLQTTGESPVMLSATLERRQSEEGPWEQEAQVTREHEGAGSITAPGRFGFGGGETLEQLPNYAYDSFSANFK